MLYKNMKEMVHSIDTKYFDIVTGVFQRDILAQYILIINLGYALWKSKDLRKENGFTQKGKNKKQKQKQRSTQTTQLI